MKCIHLFGCDRYIYSRRKMLEIYVHKESNTEHITLTGEISK